MEVKFIKWEDEILALFPTLAADPQGNILCYAHIGQHASACKSLLRKGTNATPAEYKSLLKELQNLYKPEEIEII